MFTRTHATSSPRRYGATTGLRHTLLRLAVLAATCGGGLGYALVETAGGQHP